MMQEALSMYMLIEIRLTRLSTRVQLRDCKTKEL